MITNTSFYPILEPKSRANPQVIYNQMREENPIYRYTGPQTGNTFWIFTRYDDVVSILKDSQFILNFRNLPRELWSKFGITDEQTPFDAINRHMLNTDPPDHARLRTLVHKAFTPNRIRDLQPRIEAIADDLLQAMADKETGDLISDFAYLLPITVIAEMLGIEVEKRDKFREWTNALLFFSGGEEGSQIAIMEFIAYINQLIEERRVTDKGDILSALVRASEGEDSLDHMELLSMVFLLLVAGHETTVNLITNGTLLLMQHPEQFTRLKENPELIKTAVEEILRYNGPVEIPVWRAALNDVTFKGVTIKQGDIVLPSLLAANRDPEKFENPNVFDITRDPNPHMAFGQGIHYCLGAPLARMEGTIALGRLVQQYPNISLNTTVDKLEWNNSLLIHGVKSLPVRYR